MANNGYYSHYIMSLAGKSWLMPVIGRLWTPGIDSGNCGFLTLLFTRLAKAIKNGQAVNYSAFKNSCQPNPCTLAPDFTYVQHLKPCTETLRYELPFGEVD
ncbi:hypothetical protein CBL_01625 [Carabus blaptoides fortunei]